MKLRWLFALLLLALAPATAMLGWQLHEERRERVERIEEALQGAATEFARSVNQDIASSVDALTVLSQSEIFQQGRIVAMGRLLQGRPRRDWDSIFLLDPHGAVVLDTATRATAPAFLREVHAQALAKRAPVVSGAVLQPGIAIAMPILQGEQVRYVLGVRMSDAMWVRLAAQAPFPLGGQARLYDAQGRLISQTGGRGPPGSRLPAPVLAAMNDRSVGVARSREAEGDEVIAAWDRVPLAGWYARVFVDAEPIDAAQREVLVHGLSTLGAALLAGLVLAGAAGVMLTRRSRQAG